MTTSERILDSAAALLDSGGPAAVTLRAVGQASGVSHNAPYKHYENRDALLGAIATRDFQRLAAIFTKLGQEKIKPITKLKRALLAFSEYGRNYPHRYQLLFSDPEIARQEGELRQAALASFVAFSRLVGECQQANVLLAVPTPALASLLYASVHGLIDLQSSGRMNSEKGFTNVTEGISLLLGALTKEHTR